MARNARGTHSLLVAEQCSAAFVVRHERRCTMMLSRPDRPVEGGPSGALLALDVFEDHATLISADGLVFEAPMPQGEP